MASSSAWLTAIGTTTEIEMQPVVLNLRLILFIIKIEEKYIFEDP
jgi:hypothetical protein